MADAEAQTMKPETTPALSNPCQEDSRTTPPVQYAQAGVMYVAIATLRNGESALRWTRTQIFMVLHTTALTIGLPLLVRLGLDEGYKYLAIGLVSVIGLVFATGWLLVTNRANRWVNFWSMKLEEIESHDGFPPVKVFRSKEFDDLSKGFFSFHLILRTIAIIFIFLWSIAILGVSFLGTQLARETYISNRNVAPQAQTPANSGTANSNSQTFITK